MKDDDIAELLAYCRQRNYEMIKELEEQDERTIRTIYLVVGVLMGTVIGYLCGVS